MIEENEDNLVPQEYGIQLVAKAVLFHFKWEKLLLINFETY